MVIDKALQSVSPISTADDIVLRMPSAADGCKVNALIAACPPLDPNSLYCNLLQCVHFAATCCVAERRQSIVGFVSAYRPPQQPDTLFVWQIAIAQEARGLGLGRRMFNELLARPGCAGVTELQTTITESNQASWALFKSFARHAEATLSTQTFFDRLTHLSDQHDSEILVSIGPLTSCERQPISRTRIYK